MEPSGSPKQIERPAVLDIRGWITRKIVDYLTEPLPHYERVVWNDPQALRRHVRKGDVLLVDGDSRVSPIIRYLTQSCWSHAALYVGDELLRRGGERAEPRPRDLRRRRGAPARRGAAARRGRVAPLEVRRLQHPHLRGPIGCGREHLRADRRRRVAAIGWRYDLRNVLDLARYLIPVHVVPTALPAHGAPLRERRADRGDLLEPDRPALRARCASRSCRRSSTRRRSTRRRRRAADAAAAHLRPRRARATRASSTCATRRCSRRATSTSRRTSRSSSST